MNLEQYMSDHPDTSFWLQSKESFFEVNADNYNEINRWFGNLRVVDVLDEKEVEHTTVVV